MSIMAGLKPSPMPREKMGLSSKEYNDGRTKDCERNSG
jgi:hypothetical protein